MYASHQYHQASPAHITFKQLLLETIGATQELNKAVNSEQKSLLGLQERLLAVEEGL